MSSGSNLGISTYDHVKLTRLSEKNVINSGFSLMVKDVHYMILELSCLSMSTSFLSSISNGDISHSIGRQSSPPSLGASKRFSPSNKSFIFNFSRSVGAFQFSPKELLFLFLLFSFSLL